jgi:hypothetical protein
VKSVVENGSYLEIWSCRSFVSNTTWKLQLFQVLATPCPLANSNVNPSGDCAGSAEKSSPLSLPESQEIIANFKKMCKLWPELYCFQVWSWSYYGSLGSCVLRALPPVGTSNQCFFCVFSHVEIQTANHFLSPKFWLLWFFKERNLIKRRHIFWSSIHEMGTMSDRICQISLISGEIEGHCPLKFGDGWLVEPNFMAPVWTQYQWTTASWTKLTDIDRNLASFRQN